MRQLYARPQEPDDWLAFAIRFVLYVVALVVALALIGSIMLALFLLAAPSTLAHGPAQWIEQGQYKNAVGELCCGERDCAELASDDVAITASGYFIKSIKETIPFSEATPSPTGTYWRCFWGGKRKCFFAPPPNT